MMRLIRNRFPIYMVAFPWSSNVIDHDVPLNQLDPNETGMERVKKIFITDKYGSFSDELQTITTSTALGAIAGLVVGGFLHSKPAMDNFIDNNEASRYYGQIDAKKRLQDAILVKYFRHGLGWALRVGGFCAIFTMTTTCFSAYRGEFAITDYVLGGALSGFLFKLNMGLKGTVAGTTIGAILGGISGVLTAIIVSTGGMTSKDAKFWQEKWAESMASKQGSISEHLAKERVELKSMYSDTNGLEDKTKESTAKQMPKNE